MSPTGAIGLVGALTLLGLLLRLPSFNDSLWGDELATNFVVHGFGAGDVLSIVRHGKEATPPLFFLLAWLGKGVDGSEGLRLVSLLAGLATIPLTYLVGLRTVGAAAGAVGAALVALSPFQIFYSTEARAYSLMMLFCLLACLALLIAVDSGGPGWWITYSLSAAAALYTHYTSIFVLGALFAWAVVTRPATWKPLLASTLGAALLFAPWVPEFLDDTGKQAAKNVEFFHPLTLAHAKSDLLQTYFGHPAIGVGDLPGYLALGLVAAAVALGILSVVLGLRRKGGPAWPPPPGIALVVLLAAATPVGEAIHNLFAPSLFLPRNLIASWPGFALALGAVATAGRGGLRWAASGLLLAGFAIGAVQMLSKDNQRPDFAAAAHFIEDTGVRGSPVVELPTATPGPQSAVEAALAPKGEPLPRDRRIFVLGFPTLQERIALNRRGLNLFVPVPHSTPQEVASDAAALAGDGTLFLVDERGNLDQLRGSPTTNVAQFLAALPPRFHEVDSRTFPGINLVGVHVLIGSRPPLPGHNRPFR
jgi:hypothetical protein